MDLEAEIMKDVRRYRWIKANMGIQPMFPRPAEAKPKVTIKFPGYDRRDGRLEWDIADASRLDALIDAQIEHSSKDSSNG